MLPVGARAPAALRLRCGCAPAEVPPPACVVSLIVIRIWRYAIGHRGREPVELEQLRGTIEPARAVVWIDATGVADHESAVLSDQLGLEADVVAEFKNPSQRTKLLRFAEDCFHVEVHDCELREDRIETAAVDVVIGRGWILTVRHPSEHGEAFDVEQTAHRFELQWRPDDLPEEGFLLWALLDTLADRYSETSDDIDERIDVLDARAFPENESTESPDISRDVVRLRRALMHLRRAVAPMRELLTSLDRREIPFIEDSAIPHLRDVLDRIRWTTEYVESQRDLLTGLLEAQLAVYSNRTNDVMKRMTSWGAILLGATLIAGIYGMNFRDMPELDWSLGYPFALGTMLLMTFALYFWFKHKKWL
jgi:magnesium transporter